MENKNTLKYLESSLLNINIELEENEAEKKILISNHQLLVKMILELRDINRVYDINNKKTRH